MVTEYDPEVSLRHNLLLKNRSGECCLAFANEHQLHEWSILFKELIYEFLIEAESAQLLK